MTPVEMILRMLSRHHSDRPRTVPAALANPLRLIRKRLKYISKTVIALARQSHKMDGAYKGDSYIMKIDHILNNTELTMLLEGRLDTTTSPELEKYLKNVLNGIESLIFDFEKLEYISSAGLRVLLSAQKVMRNQGSMKIIHVNSTIMEVFEITGFTDILTIE
jgi:anti-sigma B factor antagonist